MYLKPTFRPRRPALDEAAPRFHEGDGHAALLRVLVWTRLYCPALRLERSKFFPNDNAYLVLSGSGRKFLVCVNEGNLSLEAAGGAGGIEKLYSGKSEETLLEVMLESAEQLA